MVEVFCGILSDAALGPNIRRWSGGKRAANLASAFINELIRFPCFFCARFDYDLFCIFRDNALFALNPSIFAAGFEDRMQSPMDHFRNLQPVSALWNVICKIIQRY